MEDEEQLDKALEVRARLPQLRRIIVFDMTGLRDLDAPGVISLEQLGLLAREYEATHPGELAQRVAACEPGDVALPVYTSGTTGKPKGAMHGHDGIVHQPRAYPELIPAEEGGDRMCFLPLSHIAERLFGEYAPLFVGITTNFVQNPATVPENVRKLIGVHRARFLLTAAAPISPELVKWYMALGIPMLEACAMTVTCGGATCVPPQHLKIGSIGVPGAHNEMRIFGSVPATFGPGKRLGSNVSRLSQLQDGRWKVLTDYMKP